MAAWSAQMCMDNCPLPFLFQVFSVQSTGCTKYRMTTFISVLHHVFCDSVLFSSRLESVCRVPFRFWTWSEEWPMTHSEPSGISTHKKNIRQTFTFVVPSFQFDVDMKIIIPLNCSGSQPKLFINFWISWTICSAVCLGNIIHSNSTGSPLIPSNSLYWLVLLNHSSLFSHSMFNCESSRAFPTHFQESENTYTFAFMSLITSSSFTRDSHSRVQVLQLNSDTPEISKIVFANQFLSRIEQFLYRWFLICIYDGVQILGVILLRESVCVHRWSHEYSPNQRILINPFHLISWMTI